MTDLNPTAPEPRGRHCRPVDVTSPGGRIRHGYLGRTRRHAIAGVIDAYDQLDETKLLPITLLAALESAKQALRLPEPDAEPAAILGDAAAADMWAAPCLACGAEVGLACMGVGSGTHVHVDRILAVLLVEHTRQLAAPVLAALRGAL